MAMSDAAGPPRPGRWIPLVAGLAARAAVRPRLARDLLALLWAYRARDWYRRPPFLPLPPREYLAWRLTTAYAAPDAVPPAEDIVRLARWRRQLLRL